MLDASNCRLKFPVFSLRARQLENWPTVRTILPAHFNHLVESFSHKEVQFKSFCPPVKTSRSPAEHLNETPAFLLIFLVKFLLNKQLTRWLS